MKNHLIKTIFLALALLGVMSCESDPAPTLQSYIVESDEKDGFISTSIPKGILGIDGSEMSSESQAAFESVKKINVLAFPLNENNKATYEKESAELNDILKSERYKTLMTHNRDGVKAKFLYEGDADSIDEIIVFGTSDEMGMGIARIIGDDMNISQLMKMMKELENADVDTSMMKGILGDLGMNKRGDKIDNEQELQQTVEEIQADIED
ncbi:DUF4252 domain-containing protein [Nonlabens xiamenensis]|uniref:DUF4252 domain-containing protein n=1 Tax=Nonlabens xiamenensis TaxID=2341043 RepID=UPI000F615C0A|nr:DUF4252 domain-containing protein [Nonlabens xiamenensis]